MSSGSYFTLYRKYTAKASKEEVADIIKRYEKANNDWNISTDINEHPIDLPIILNPKIGCKESEYDEVTKKWNDLRDYSISGCRANYLRILRDDNYYLDELLHWDFGSSFDCLKNEWSMDPYRNSSSSYIVDKNTAVLMLQACNYLLNGKWIDDIERLLDNKWIKIFTTGNTSNYYWKYIYRNNKSKLNNIEADESNDEIESQLFQLKHAFEAFVYSDTLYFDNYSSEYILVYTVW